MSKLPTFTFTRQNLAWLVSAMLIVALLTSKFLLSIGMVALVAIGLVRKDVLDVLRNFWSNKALVATASIFVIVLISGAYSENITYLTERLRIKLPLLLLPIAFAGIPKFSRWQHHSLLYLLLILMSICSLQVGIHYALNYEALNEIIGKSGVVPTPIHHIRFSLLMALAFFVGLYLYQRQFYLKWAWEKYLLLGASGVLLILIHILSVRSGLLALYLAGFALVVRYIFRTRRYFMGFAMTLAIVALPVIAFYSSTSFQTKVQLMQHNFQEFFVRKNIGEYSDTQRLASYYIAIKTAENTPLFGVGMGDVKDAMAATYQQHYPDIPPKLPHNQFLFFYTATGWLGVLAFVLAFLVPFCYKKRFTDPLFIAFYAIVFTSLMVESTLETAIGTAFYIFFLMWIGRMER